MKKILFFSVLLFLSFLFLKSPTFSDNTVFAADACQTKNQRCGSTGGPGFGSILKCCGGLRCSAPDTNGFSHCEPNPGLSDPNNQKVLKIGDTCSDSSGGPINGKCPAGSECGPNHKCGDIPPICQCNTPNRIGKDDKGNGYNGYHCDKPNEDKKGACEKANMACEDTPNQIYVNKGQRINGIVCTEPYFANCKCGNEGESGAGQNGFTCKDPADGKDVTNFCNHSDISCVSTPGEVNTITVQDTLHIKVQGIDCVGPTPLPPPPPPPCINFGSQGQCLTILTSLGAFATDPGDFILKVFSIALGLSGGIALILILRAGYRIMTSRGNPEAIQQGREQLIAAIVGLVFLIFSFVILEVVGVDILRIPGFSSQKGSPVDHCNSCEAASSCSARGGQSRGVLDCTGGSICCE